jgi:hypothetical protein
MPEIAKIPQRIDFDIKEQLTWATGSRSALVGRRGGWMLEERSASERASDDQHRHL